MKNSLAVTHEECWLLLPWLANGHLGAGERRGAEEHLHGCEPCTRELARQRLICEALTEPERLSYAPGPSFRKLLARIDTTGAAPRREAKPAGRSAGRSASWRPPGLAWAATFILAMALGVLGATFYRWSQPAYSTYTSSVRGPQDVLHIAFDRSLPVGQVEELLHSAGARVVEGPSDTGIFGIAPLADAQPRDAATGAGLRALAQRLHEDPRVRWIEPLPAQHVQEPARRQP
jgi:hypothetical protein